MFSGFVVNGLVYTNFTSWERRYGYSSTQMAWVAGSYDVAAGSLYTYFTIPQLLQAFVACIILRSVILVQNSKELLP